MRRVRLELFGGFQLLAASGAPIPVTAKKVRALAAYLALLRGQSRSRDALAALLWDDSAPAQGRSSLRQALSVLRKAIGGDALAGDGDDVALSPAALSCDALELEELSASSDADAIAAAARLYRGELLEGLCVRSAPFDDWLMGERQRLHQLAIGALGRLVDAEQHRDPRRAVHAAVRLLSLDALQEPVHRALMRLYAGSGNRAAALRQYQVCRELLSRELGVEPDPDTAALYEAIRDRRAAVLPAAATLEDAANAPRLHLAAVLVARLGEPVPTDTALWRAVAARTVSRYGGRVVRQTSDSIAAVFGVPRARGNDAERAVRAAAELAAAEVGGAGALRTQVGVASGHVMASGDGASGAPLSQAAQLAAAAEPGEVLAAAAVAQAVGARAELDSAPRAAGASVLRLLRDAPMARAAAPFVGRAVERRQLAAALEVCAHGDRGHAVVVCGEAGLGKTRLVDEACAEADALGMAIHRGRLVDFGARADEGVRTIARSLLELGAGAGEAERVAALERAIADGQVAAERRASVAELLDLPLSPAQRAVYEAMDAGARERAAEAALAQLAAAAGCRRPALVVVDDLHWAEAQAARLVAALVCASASAPVVVVATCRDTGRTIERLRRDARGAPLSVLHLAPLSDAEANALAGALADDPVRAARCVRRAEGNPLFLEHLLATGGDEIPDSIQSLLLARADALAPADRLVLQAAAVLGQRVTEAPLAHLAAGRCHPGPLVAAGLLVDDGDALAFAHALIADTVYAAILPAERAGLHRRAAAYYRQREPALAAEHLDRAGDEGAARAYLTAAEPLGATPERALRLVDRALAIAAEPDVRAAALCRRGELLRELGRAFDAIAAYGRALEAAPDDHARCRALIGLAGARRLVDDTDTALADLARAELFAHELGRDSDLAEIHYQRGNLLFPRGDTEGCRAAHLASLAIARRIGSPLAEARASSGLGDADYLVARMVSAHAHFSRCVQLCREHGFARLEVANLHMLGLTRLYQNDLAGAAADCLRAADTAARIGDRRAEVIARAGVPLALSCQADWPQVMAECQRALELARELGARRFEPLAMGHLAEARAAAGDRDQAEALLTEAYAISRQTGRTFAGLCVLGIHAAVTGDDAVRRRCLDAGAELAGERCVSHGTLTFYQRAIEACLGAGDHHGALDHAEHLADFTRAEPLPWSEFVIARARALVERRRGDRSTALRERLAALLAEADRSGFRAARPALAAALS